MSGGNPFSGAIRWVDSYGEQLKKWPDDALALALLAVAAVLIVTAFRGNTAEKAIVLAWALLP